MELTRKQIIDNLSSIMDSMLDDVCGDWRNSLAYAISSLKTDEAYHLMYEGGEIFTVDEVIDMLEELKKVIESQPTYRIAITDSSGLICYGYTEREPSAKDAVKHIQAKINALRGDEDESC